MKILLLADEESKYYWDYFEKSKLEGIDLIISCGDLAPQFLSFMATFAKVPILYVHGNHDACYDETPPDGCICIDDDVYVHEGVRIAGLGGSMCYNFGMYQFTEDEMKKRVRKLRRKIKKAGGLDILITHSPAFELNDSTDLPHTGFRRFIRFWMSMSHCCLHMDTCISIMEEISNGFQNIRIQKLSMRLKNTS